jgi:hypothetical protein
MAVMINRKICLIKIVTLRDKKVEHMVFERTCVGRKCMQSFGAPIFLKNNDFHMAARMMIRKSLWMMGCGCVCLDTMHCRPAKIEVQTTT